MHLHRPNPARRAADQAQSHKSAAALLLCALVLLVAGPGVTELARDLSASHAPSDPGFNCLLQQGFDASSEAGGMAGGDLPWTDRAASLEALVFTQSVNNGYRSGVYHPSIPFHRSVTPASTSRTPIRATFAGVSVSLGRLFTLVGAKPSGTM